MKFHVISSDAELSGECAKSLLFGVGARHSTAIHYVVKVSWGNWKSWQEIGSDAGNACTKLRWNLFRTVKGAKCMCVRGCLGGGVYEYW